MKILFLNAIPYGSTGKIVDGISDVAKKEGHTTLTYLSWTKKYRKSDRDDVIVGSFFGKLSHIIRGRLTGKNGLYSKRDTKRLLKVLDSLSLPISHNVSAEKIIDAMSHDKKKSGDSITAVRVERIGSFTLSEISFEELKEEIGKAEKL